jgi:hypothetical protein
MAVLFYQKKQVSTSVDKKKFKQYPIGYFYINIAEVRTAKGKLWLDNAIQVRGKK